MEQTPAGRNRVSKQNAKPPCSRVFGDNKRANRGRKHTGRSVLMLGASARVPACSANRRLPQKAPQSWRLQRGRRPLPAGAGGCSHRAPGHGGRSMRTVHLSRKQVRTRRAIAYHLRGGEGQSGKHGSWASLLSGSSLPCTSGPPGHDQASLQPVRTRLGTAWISMTLDGPRAEGG